ncbi:LysR family transcriptional regulator [Aciduricibacillus chroicocephali]|uniref:LysR family transcriptional regulator n=1 Tax=Aciduricibacillus chroicocephali TaxID=3054939 RepID=A0ABY9KU47_9BACI|nr:LysR family transcriptional regulator [Bacillaceae bacterium 44XB]
MELRQIKYFIEVAKREHVTEAANELHVAQSAVSRALANLEEELGVQLFIREGRNVRLTPIGRIFLERMQQAMRVIGDARQIIEEYTDPERGTVNVGFPSSLATYMLPTAISAFRNEYPHAKFHLHQGSYRQLMDAVIRGDINMALLGPVPMDDTKLKGKILFTEQVVALLPANHRLAKAKSLALTELREEPFVVFAKGFVLRDLLMDACRQNGFDPIISFEGEDIDAIKGLVSAGLGVSLVPEITLIDNLPRSTVKVPISEPQVRRSVGMVIPKERDLLPTEKIFADFIEDFFARLTAFQK